MPALAKLPSRAAEDYLKAVYKLQKGSAPVSTTALAERLARSAASVTNMVKSLADQGLLEHMPYHGVRLTPTGERSALRIIRRHRIIELYLIEKLAYTWDSVHDEAERLEHAVSDELVERMAQALGDPEFDPHGAPIPTADGRIAERSFDRLLDLGSGEPAVVREVGDRDAGQLKQLVAVGLRPGTRILVRALDEGSGVLEVEVGGETVEIEPELARVVFIEREAGGESG